MRYKLFLLLSVFLIPLICFSQITFFKTYGNPIENHDDVGRSVMQTEDGGYIIAGITNRFSIFGQPSQYYGDVYLVKTDQNGDTLWTKIYGDTGAVRETAYSMDNTNDGGFIISTYYTDGKEFHGLCLLKTNSEGYSIWTKKFALGEGFCIKKTTDGGYIITGSGAYGEADIYLLKVDALGDSVWLKTFDRNFYYEEGRYVQQTLDSGFIIVGNTEFPEPRYEDIWLIKTNVQGDTLWTRTYGGDYYDYAYSLCETEDGGYFIAGNYTEPDGEGYELRSHLWLLRTDCAGDTIWTKRVEGSVSDNAYSCKQTPDGGFIVMGETYSRGSDIYLVKLDAGGNIQWSNIIGGPEYEYGYDIAYTSDMGYAITGSQAKDNYQDFDLFLLKVNSEGQLTSLKDYSTNQLKQFTLFQNYPNPFNPQTKISFYLQTPGKVTITIFNTLGQKLSTLFDGVKTAGLHKVSFNAKGLSSGIYYYRIEANGFNSTRKMLYVR